MTGDELVGYILVDVIEGTAGVAERGEVEPEHKQDDVGVAEHFDLLGIQTWRLGLNLHLWRREFREDIVPRAAGHHDAVNQEGACQPNDQPGAPSGPPPANTPASSPATTATEPVLNLTGASYQAGGP